MTKIKLVIWDLDNTLWDGTVFYKDKEAIKLKAGTKAALKELDKRGIRNSICSKNYSEDALAFLEKFDIIKYFEHPQIGWGKKSEGIKKLLDIFKVRADEALFIDDDAFQRAEVSAHIPEINVIELIDPIDILNVEGVIPENVTEIDQKRVIVLKQQRDREEAEKSHTGDYKEFLRQCEIQMKARLLHEKDWPRIVQLLNRTNELNATGNRYQLEELQNNYKNGGVHILVVELTDKFGDYGLIAETIVDEIQENGKIIWSIRDLTVSCRTMGRGIGSALVTVILEEAKRKGISQVVGYVRETESNWRMKPLFEKRGFSFLSMEGDKTTYQYVIDERELSFPDWISITNNVDLHPVENQTNKKETSPWKLPLFKMYTSQKDITAVNKVLERGTFWADGPEVKEFEKRISQFNERKYAVAFNSGTSSLHALYEAVDVREKEVIVPSLTFIATVNAVVLAGGIPVFAESEEETLGLDADDVIKKITSKTKAIVAFHYSGGVSRDIEKLREICKEKNILLLEDNAHSMGVRKNGQMCGTFGEAAILSFCQNKLITTGEGGAVITDSEELYQKLRLFRSHGRVDPVAGDYFSTTEDSEYVNVGGNFRMATMNAALGTSQLDSFEDMVSLRQGSARKLNEALSKIKEIRTPVPFDNSDHFYQMYTIVLENKDLRDGLQDYLAKEGIMSKRYFPPCHLNSFYKVKYNCKDEDLPITENLCGKILTLPMFPGMKDEEIMLITGKIKDYFQKNVSSKIESSKNGGNKMQNQTIKIGDHEIGEGKPAFIIAEIGINHNGDMEIAKKLIDAAKDAGCDVAKFQSWTANGLFTKNHPDYERAQGVELPWDKHQELVDYCKEIGIMFMSSAFSEPEVDFVESLGVPAHKIASCELTNLPLLKYFARTKKPLIMSTGFGKIEEVREAVETIRNEGNNQIILLHCIGAYPPKIEEINLKFMNELAKEFNVLIGLSDHSREIVVPQAAVARGAVCIERHITLDNNMVGFDHQASTEPQDFKEIITGIRIIEKALGSGERSIIGQEADLKKLMRKSILASKDLKSGEILTQEMITIKRPGEGLPAKEIPNLVGKKLSKDLAEGNYIRFEDIEESS